MGNIVPIKKNQIDFKSIYKNSQDAMNQTNVLKVNSNYWGDNGELSYQKLDNGTYLIYEGNQAMGFTDHIIEVNNDIQGNFGTGTVSSGTVPGETIMAKVDAASQTDNNVTPSTEPTTSGTVPGETIMAKVKTVAQTDNDISGFSDGGEENIQPIEEVSNELEEVCTFTVESDSNSIYPDDPSMYRYGETTAKLVQIAKNAGLNDDQITIALGISMWETENFTKISLNNYGGVTGEGPAGKWYSERDDLNYRVYNNQEEGMIDFIRNLKENYFDLGLNTMDEIGRRYCGHEASGYNANVLERIRNGIWAKK